MAGNQYVVAGMARVVSEAEIRATRFRRAKDQAVWGGNMQRTKRCGRWGGGGRIK